MARARKLLAEPLVYFLLAGAAILAVVSFFSEESADEAGAASASKIFVDTAALEQFVQAKTRIDDPEEFVASYGGLSPAAKREWIERFVREEALVREARRLGLHEQDDLIRRRLVQQIEFVALGVVEAELEFGPEELARTYEERVEDYRVPTTLSFSHVFIRAEGEAESTPSENSTGARAYAAEMLGQLNAEAVSAREAHGRGDRFLYNRNYVDRTIEEVISHFGREMADMLTALEVDSGRWQGPFESPHGLHLVLLTHLVPSHLPEMEDIRDLLHEDWRRDTRDRALDQAVSKIISGFSVELDGELQQAIPGRGAAR